MTRTAMPYWLGYALIWALSVLYLGLAGEDWVFPIAVLVIFGGFASGIAWLLTRKTNAPEVPVNRPGVELSVTLLYLLLYALVFLGWGLGALREMVPAGAAQDWLVLGAKLVVHVAIPALLLFMVGGAVRPLFDTGLNRPGFWPTLIVIGLLFLALLAVVSPSLRNIGALNPPVATLLWAAPLSYVLISLEAGLSEEFLFRAVLQSRLAAFLRSPTGAIPVASIVFALAHLPGLYLRGGPGVDGWSTDPVQVAAFTIATLSPLSLFFGFLWWRTRSLLLIVLLHGAIDVLPNMPEFLTHFAL
jgi:membrane protease YdiL (CAAX protease family)